MLVKVEKDEIMASILESVVLEKGVNKKFDSILKSKFISLKIFIFFTQE